MYFPPSRTLSRTALILVTIATVLATAVAPAGARSAATDAEAQPTDARPSDVRPDIRPDIRPDVEVLRLRCRGVVNDHGLPEVRCKWTAPTSAAAHVVVLERNAGDGWRPLWRTANVERNRYVDGSIEAGQRYRYRIRVYDAERHLVAASRSNGAGVPVVDLDVLKIACEAGSHDELGKVAKCEWSASDEARYYELWRLVNRGHRELVGTFDAGTFAARDDVPEDAAVVRYAVLAFDSDGEMVGRSRATTVRFRLVDAA